MGMMEKIEKTGPATSTSRRQWWGRRLIDKMMCTGSLLGALFGTACGLQEWAHHGFKVGPSDSRPQAPGAEEWNDYSNPTMQSQEVDLSHWWQILDDKHLNSLIETAYEQNLSLRVAGSRILEAQAVRGIAV